jgi:hypothetical protein
LRTEFVSFFCRKTQVDEVNWGPERNFFAVADVRFRSYKILGFAGIKDDL